MKRKRIKKNKKKFFRAFLLLFRAIFVLAILIGSVFLAHKWIQNSHLFIVKNFEFEGNIIIETPRLYSIVQKEKSKNIFKINSKEMINSIKEIPFVESISISRKLPSTVRIKIKEVEPSAVLIGEKTVTLNSKGELLPKLKPNRVHDLVLITGISLKEKQKQKIKQVSEIISLLKREDINLYNDISEINFNREKITMFLYNTGVPIYLKFSDIEDKIMRLKSFLNYYSQDKQLIKLEYIDLCFRDQVVIKEET